MQPQQSSSPGPERAAIDMAFISPFLSATKKVLTTMAQVEVSPLKPQKSRDALPQGDVAGFMPMSTPDINGQLIISFQKAAILKIVSNMLMEEFTELNDEVVDCVGEITNMVTGAAKALVETEHNFNMATPTAALKSDYHKTILAAPIQIVIPYKVCAGLFCIELGFVKN